MVKADIAKEDIVRKIDDYLSGKIDKTQASRWAIEVISRKCFGVDEILLEDAITALSSLHDEDERWDVSRDDLTFYKECLMGKRPYGVKVEFLPYKDKVAAA